uniref:Uncharacterized protein n=3 Tax=Glycine subgen. Soja TaxID=1462606 RepID=A0A0R0EJD4_SOYBN
MVYVVIFDPGIMDMLDINQRPRPSFGARPLEPLLPSLDIESPSPDPTLGVTVPPNLALNERLESVLREALKSVRFEFATQGLKELKGALRIGEENDREPLVYGLLRKEWSQCFEEKSSWMRCFGRLTWPRISELIISSFLSKLPDFQKIIVCSSEFEKCNGPFGWLQCFSLTYSRLLRLENSYERSTSSIMFSGKVILRKETTSIDSLTTNRLSPNALTSVVPLMIVNRRLRLQCVDRLTKIMCAILESYASEDRRHVDYVAISKCEEFRRINSTYLWPSLPKISFCWKYCK